MYDVDVAVVFVLDMYLPRPTQYDPAAFTRRLNWRPVRHDDDLIGNPPPPLLICSSSTWPPSWDFVLLPLPSTTCINMRQLVACVGPRPRSQWYLVVVFQSCWKPQRPETGPPFLEPHASYCTKQRRTPVLRETPRPGGCRTSCHGVVAATSPLCEL